MARSSLFIIMCCLHWLFVIEPVSADVVVVVNKDNPIQKLTDRQIKMLYLGKKTKLTGSVKAKLIDLSVDHPARAQFYDRATNKTVAQAQRYWAAYAFSGKGQQPLSVMSEEDVINFLKNYPLSGVGYFDSEFVTEDIKVVYRYP